MPLWEWGFFIEVLHVRTLCLVFLEGRDCLAHSFLRVTPCLSYALTRIPQCSRGSWPHCAQHCVSSSDFSFR